MLKGETILCLAYSRWPDQITDWELMRRFATFNKVIFVELQQKYEILRWGGKTKLECLRTFIPEPPHWINQNLVVIKSPSMLPMYVSLLSRLFRQAIGRYSIMLSKRIFEQYIKHQLSRIRIQPSILWVHQPEDCLLAGRFGERLVCYRTYDEVSLFPSNVPFQSLIDELERRSIGKADVVFASSRSQYEKRKIMNPNTYLLPNAVDFDLFIKARTCDYSKPPGLQKIRPPVIGFMGALDHRFDFNLLQHIAISNPKWSIVLVGLARGYVVEKVRRLANVPNVYWLGNKSRKELPRYLKWFDVATIPYLTTPATNTMYPWKLHEYLAAGLPVVSTNLCEVQPFAGMVRLARSPEEFVAMINEELQGNSEEKVQQRVAIARKNSWDRRVAEMSKLLAQVLTKN